MDINLKKKEENAKKELLKKIDIEFEHRKLLYRNFVDTDRVDVGFGLIMWSSNKIKTSHPIFDTVHRLRAVIDAAERNGWERIYRDWSDLCINDIGKHLTNSI
jgi:hypothetical protein